MPAGRNRGAMQPCRSPPVVRLKPIFVMGFFDLFRKKQDTPADTAAGAAVEAQPEQRREELNAGLERTKTGLFSKLARAVAGRSTVDAEVLDDLEEVLITSDVGGSRRPSRSSAASRSASRATRYMNAAELRGILRDEIAALMEQSHASTKDFGLELPGRDALRADGRGGSTAQARRRPSASWRPS